MSAGTHHRVSTRRLVMTGLGVCLLLAGVVSVWASANPDGLKFVAERLGFGSTAGEHAAADSPLADYGTAHGSLEAAGWGNRPAAGKTGTTQNYRSSAFLGFTPFYAGATMVFDYQNGPQPICRTPTLRTCTDDEAQNGQGMGGGSVPAPQGAATLPAPPAVPASGAGQIPTR